MQEPAYPRESSPAVPFAPSGLPDILLKVGEARTVELPDRGTAGYLWDRSSLHPVAREVAADLAPRADSHSDLVGDENRLLLTLEGLVPGMIRLVEARPWEGPRPSSRAVTVIVSR